MWGCPSCISVLVVYFLAAVCLATNTPLIANLTTDQSALLAFRAHIDPNDVLAHNWSAATSCCTWFGVTCGLGHRRVTALSLGSMGLSGTIPPHLGNLSFLASLNLRDNSFHGDLPHEFGFLHRMKYFDLTYNNLTGEFPLWLGNFTKLQIISLTSNHFHGRIQWGVFKSTQLQVLSLSINSFTGRVPRGIGNFTMLKYLYLNENNLEGVIPHDMGNLISLELLNLGTNNLRGEFPLWLGNFTKIQKLSLSSNQFHGRIQWGVFKSTQLQILSLSDNSFTGRIPRGIGNYTMLKELFLYENNLEGVIPQEMENLISLEILNLYGNNLTGPIPPFILNISTIKLLSLASNHLSGQLPPTTGLWLPNLDILLLWGNKLEGEIPNSISNASKLTVLELGSNSFTGFVPNTLGDLRLLERLNVVENFLTTESSTLELRFLTSLTNCKNLRKVGFANNPMVGFLPISIQNLSNSLEYFYAHGCKIRGSIPREIGNLSNLIILTLGDNDFTGSIPTTIEKLHKLQALDVGPNRLQGSIPYSLCHLKSIFSLSLKGNMFYGSIPMCVDNLTSLRYLYLDSNKLTSIIPSTLWGLRDILEINLSTNSLSGHLPVDVGNLKVATTIDFSNNQLSGHIPDTIGGLQNLLQLSLANNRLQGPIPPSFGNMINLEFLDISNNSIFGVIPKTLEALSHLKDLNLSSNGLEGEIPHGGCFTNFSAQSFMMNLALCGAARFRVPPCTVDTLHRSKTTTPLLKYILLTFASIFLLVAITLVLLRRRKKHVRSPCQADLSPVAWRRISYHQLVHATNEFCESKLLGMGSFSSVYRGILSDGLNVAVKVFNLQLEGAFKSFETECEVLRNIRHRNLIKVISSCANTDFKCLVLEYMSNGSLDKWLYSFNYCLDIFQRLNIMIDVASALEYLHHGYSTIVVHSDLKPSNVLLSEDMVAKVGDFGIAKLLGEEDSMTHTKTLATMGYMAPEYGQEGIVSSRVDVYSFGILMMETFTRKKPTDEMFVGKMSLKSWVKDSIPHGLTQVADANLLRPKEEYFLAKKECISSILNIALACSLDIPGERMDIKDVLGILKEIKTKLQMSVM